MCVSPPLPDSILEWSIGTIDGILIEISLPTKGQMIIFFTIISSKASAASYSYHYKEQDSVHIHKSAEELLLPTADHKNVFQVMHSMFTSLNSSYSWHSPARVC
jgi:hypothetical protein